MLMDKNDEQNQELEAFFDGGFGIGPNGIHRHTIKTYYGQLFYLYFPEVIENQFRCIAGEFLWHVHHGQPLDELLAQIKEQAGAEFIDATVDMGQELSQECIQMADRAMALFKKGVQEMLAKSAEQYFVETLFRALREHNSQGSFVFNATETEMIKPIIRVFTKALKQRLEAPTAGGSEPEWTTKRQEAFLKQYELALATLKEAKRIYRQNKRSKQWNNIVKAAYPELPDDLIAQLGMGGKNAEPSRLALEYAAKLFGVEPSSYLEKVLASARRKMADNEMKF
jgi:hypothetical protein